MNRILRFSCLLLLILGSCHKVPEEIEPQLNQTVQDKYLKQLPEPFPPLTDAEKETSWGREYLIGITFARQLDLYQAITAFKRAEILAPAGERERKMEMNYEILLCYYIGQRYVDATNVFETTNLDQAQETFPAFHDLLLILYDSYIQAGNEVKAARTLALIKHYYPQDYEKLKVSTAVREADFSSLEKMSQTPPSSSYINPFLEDYEREKKSIAKAQGFNALLPGAGYLYLGQKQSALTAFLLNGVFIAATYHFFHHGDIAAGIVFASFEAGWYFGGIYGAGLEAKYYNERLYEKKATPLMNNEGLFPVLMLQYSF